MAERLARSSIASLTLVKQEQDQTSTSQPHCTPTTTSRIRTGGGRKKTEKQKKKRGDNTADDALNIFRAGTPQTSRTWMLGFK
jgi:hypothetical protein